MEGDVIAARVERARELTQTLIAQGIRAVALTNVDNSGITLVKTVPVSLLERATRFGIGLSPIFDVHLVNDLFTSTGELGGPVGDLRLMPDTFILRPLAAQPGWAWAPTDQFTQEGEPFACCQRTFARRMAERLSAESMSMRLAFELEWFVARVEGDDVTPIHRGPAYSAAVLAQVSDYARDLIVALEDEGVGVEQFHPEYATGQLEISVAPGDPVGAADMDVLVRQTIRGVSARHGYRASFAPVAIVGEVGNGGHIHFSLWEDSRNLFAGGNGPHGMTAQAEAFVAGVIDELPALVAVGAPSVASYLRLIPHHWAGAFACWGRENREAAVRFVTGMVGTRETAANTEVKCFDGSANPYLVAGCLIAAGLSGVERKLRLPPEVTVDPGTLSAKEQEQLKVRRLPESLDDAVAHLEKSEVIREAMGDVLFNAFVAVRRGEAEAFAGKEDAEVVEAHRWRY
ncbi:MAG: glutamine synthetase [Actinobacteria bacterium]|nr:MAG: glutamine synthetase [Actinomycetota bacterium]